MVEVQPASQHESSAQPAALPEAAIAAGDSGAEVGILPPQVPPAPVQGTPGVCTWPNCLVPNMLRHKCRVCNIDDREHMCFCGVNYMGMKAFDDIQRLLNQDSNLAVFLDEMCFPCFVVSSFLLG
jgi:hypothetical protein